MRRRYTYEVGGTVTLNANLTDAEKVEALVKMLTDERAGRARVVEVDVGEQQVLDVAELDATGAECLVERGQAARRAAVEEREAVVGLDEVRRDAARVAAVEKVERLGRHAGDRSRVSRTVAAGIGL